MQQDITGKKQTRPWPIKAGLTILGPMQTESPLVSTAQKQKFIDEGYCVVEGLFSPGEIDEIEAFFEEFKASDVPAFDTGKSYQGSFQESDPARHQMRALHPHRYNKKAQDWLLNPRVGDVLAELLGRPALAVQSMYYFKPPGGKGQGMHQDNFYLVSKPATCIAAWTAIDAADLDNGCLWVVPGSNHGHVLCPEKGGEHWMNYGDTHITKFPREQKPVPVPVPRGATMFFSGNLIHGSGPNRTKDRFRRTFIGHYIDEASEQVGRFYHPVLNMAGETVSNVAVYSGGGPCGDGWQGAVH
jgi:ectoine hydroxylase-related dioxygenase (phytanoyl-CoA dioxygenase family)